MKLLMKIWSSITFIWFMLRGVFRHYVVPAIHFVQAIKHLIGIDGDMTDKVIQEVLKQLFPADWKNIVKYMNAFVKAVVELLPSHVFADVDKRSFYDVARATISFLRSQSDSKIVYGYLLMIASKMFVVLWGKPMHSTEAMLLTQVGYSYMKRKNMLLSLNA